jgi:hypothetical protein
MAEITSKKGRPVAREGGSGETSSPKQESKKSESTADSVIKATDAGKQKKTEDPDSARAKKVADNKARNTQMERKSKRGKGEKYEKAKGRMIETTINNSIYTVN